MKRATAANLRRRQLDRIFDSAAPLKPIAVPERGWIREIRLSLGMTAAQLGHRLSISHSAVLQLERAEIEGGITLRTLRTVAQALGCDVKYVLLPARPLEEIVRARAVMVATDLARTVNDSMALEAQDNDREAVEQQAIQLADELVRRLDHSLWDQSHEVKGP